MPTYMNDYVFVCKHSGNIAFMNLLGTYYLPDSNDIKNATIPYVNGHGISYLGTNSMGRVYMAFVEEEFQNLGNHKIEWYPVFGFPERMFRSYRKIFNSPEFKLAVVS